MGYLFAGSSTLTRFILRRDRLRLILWVAGLSLFVVALAPVFTSLAGTSAESMMMAQMMQNPAMVAIVGPVYGADHFTTGAAYANEMLLFSVMIAAAMNIFLVARHTRKDEELGRLEVIRSLPVGRLANLASTLTVALSVNVTLALMSGLGMFAVRQEGMDFSGCMLFGASMGVIGVFFAASTAIFCQITANNRTATGLSLLLMLLLYLMRAAGDLNSEMLSRISPLGLILRTQNFVNDYWWPVWIIFGVTVVFMASAFFLASMRDLGRGLISERAGRRHASALLGSPYALALKLLRPSLITWTVVILVFAAMYGSVFGDLESFIGSNDMLKAIFSANSAFTYAEQFIALLMSIISMVSAVPVLSFINRVAVEEKRGHAEHLLGRAVSRQAQMAAYFLPAMVMSVLFQLYTALGFWSVGSMVLDAAPSLGVFTVSALSYLPAIWVMAGLIMALTAFLPGQTSLAFFYLGYGFFGVYIGSIANLPDWIKKLSPFGHIPQYPLESMSPAPLIILTAIAAILAVAGFWGYRRRDMRAQ